MASQPFRLPWQLALGAMVGTLLLLGGIVWWRPGQRDADPALASARIHDWYHVWWQTLPSDLREQADRAKDYSNIAPDDYVGAETCATCHEKNFHLWSSHPHRWMNAVANEATVKGRFDGSTLELRGGTATMSRDQRGRYRMRLQRGDHMREFRITHTIGSRLQQYYVGVLEKGADLPSPAGAAPSQGHRAGADVPPPESLVVLPVGFRIKHDLWAPTYSVQADNDSDATPDPFEHFEPTAYYDLCGKCHTTMPQGYRMLFDNTASQLNKPAFHLELQPFLQETLAAMSDAPGAPPTDVPQLNQWVRETSQSYSPERAAALGISCEACHLGGREHVNSGGDVPPRFFPSSPHIAHAGSTTKKFGRTHENVNLVCAQCHSAPRDLHPSGAATVNSSEYRDARSGSCYSRLRCVDCHEPHTATGPAWSKTPEQDDESCVRCHEAYRTPEAREDHTHHPAGSAGARCMNCHMPRITEGLEDMVRTHQISSPTNSQIIGGGGPNACNLCHLDRAIDWTVQQLATWYGAKFDEQELARAYPQRTIPIGEQWLRDRRSSTRMAAMGAVKRNRAEWLVPHLVNELNDFHLINRQFAQDTVETVLGIRLRELGYQYWMQPQERVRALHAVRAKVRDAVAENPEGPSP